MATNRASHARSAILWGAAVFAALQFGLTGAIETWFAVLRDPDYVHKQERWRARASTSPPPLTVIMMGSSRTVFGLQGLALERQLAPALGRSLMAFNFGFYGAGPVSELIYLRRLLARGTRPDLLLIEVLPPLLAGQAAVADAEFPRLPADHLTWSEVRFLEKYHDSHGLLSIAWWEHFLCPWYGHRFAILSRVAPAWLPYHLRFELGASGDDSGWVPSVIPRGGPREYQSAVARARSEYAGYLAGFSLGGPSCRALEELLDLARKENIASALVLMPEGSEFRALYSPEVWDKVDVYLNSLCRRFPTKLVNARCWAADGLFADSHHLIPNGAALFTQRLGRECVQPQLMEAKLAQHDRSPRTTRLPH